MGRVTGGGFDCRLTASLLGSGRSPGKATSATAYGVGLAHPYLRGSDLSKNGRRLGQMSSPSLCIPVSAELQLFHEDVLAFPGCENHVEDKLDSELEHSDAF